MRYCEKGQIVKMVNCEESKFYADREWVCKTNSFITNGNEEVVLLHGFSGRFLTKFLEKVK